MGNLGGGEILVILLVALIVLGPTKLPPAVRQVGKFVGEIRRIGQGFQQELREAAKPLTEATADLKAADKSLRETTQKPLKEMTDTIKAADPRRAIAPPPDPKDKAKAKDAAASDRGVDATGAAAAGTVSWGAAEAKVSPPPAPSSEATEATTDAAGSSAVEPHAEPAVEPGVEPGVEPAVEPAAEPAVEPAAVGSDAVPEPASEADAGADAGKRADTAD